MNQQQLLHKWNFPHLVHGGVTLVARENAGKCLRMVIEQKCHLHGYDGFTLHSDGRIQPHLEWSANWSWEALPSLSTMLRDVLDSPAEVTHFEFVFSDATLHYSSSSAANGSPLAETNTMSTYQSSWQRTKQLLTEAKTLLSPEVAAANASDLKQFDEFLEANELGLAFEWLASIAYEGQPSCVPLLQLLWSSAHEMKLHERATELHDRLKALTQRIDA